MNSGLRENPDFVRILYVCTQSTLLVASVLISHQSSVISHHHDVKEGTYTCMHVQEYIFRVEDWGIETKPLYEAPAVYNGSWKFTH